MSVSYLQDDITWCVSPAKPIRRWKNILYITRDKATIFIGSVLFIIYLISIYLWIMFEEKPLDFFLVVIYTTEGLVGFSTSFQPKKSIIRIYFIVALVIAFWMNQIFCAYFFIFIPQQLYEPQIESVEHIMTNNFRLSSDTQIFQQLKNRNMVSIFEYYSNCFYTRCVTCLFFSLRMSNWATLKFALILTSVCIDCSLIVI